jgi:hypothetical protein
LTLTGLVSRTTNFPQAARESFSERFYKYFPKKKLMQGYFSHCTKNKQTKNKQKML